MFERATPQVLRQIDSYGVGYTWFGPPDIRGSILLNRYDTSSGTPVYVDTMEYKLSAEELAERTTATIHGKSLGDELLPWAVAKLHAAGLLPEDAVYVGGEA